MSRLRVSSVNWNFGPKTGYTLDGGKYKESGQLPIFAASYHDNHIFKPSKINLNPHKDDFDDDICHLKAKSVADTVKCYIIAILYDVQCFSLKNFSPDGPAAISFLIAKIGLHKKSCRIFCPFALDTVWWTLTKIYISNKLIIAFGQIEWAKYLPAHLVNFKFSFDFKKLKEQIVEHITQPLKEYFFGLYANYRGKVKDFGVLVKEKILEWIDCVKMIYVLPRNYIKSHFRRLYGWGLSLKEPLKETWSMTKDLWKEALEESKESSD